MLRLRLVTWVLRGKTYFKTSKLKEENKYPFHTYTKTSCSWVWVKMYFIWLLCFQNNFNSAGCTCLSERSNVRIPDIRNHWPCPEIPTIKRFQYKTKLNSWNPKFCETSFHKNINETQYLHHCHLVQTEVHLDLLHEIRIFFLHLQRSPNSVSKIPTQKAVSST